MHYCVSVMTVISI